MALDLDKIIKQVDKKLAETKPEIFDNKQTSSNSSGKTETIQDKAKTDAYIKNSVWNTKYQPAIDKIGFDNAINYSNSLHMMKAVNGRYDNILNSKDVSDEAKQTIKTLKNSSIAAMDEIVKMSQGDGNIKLLEKYRGDADKAEFVLKNQLGDAAGKNYVYNPDTKIISDRVTFKKNNQSANREKRDDDKDKYSTTTGVGEGGTNPLAGYLQMKDYTQRSMNQVKSQVKPLVTAWSNNAMNLLNTDNKVAGRIDPKNREKILAYAKDVLTFASKYGVQSGNKDYDSTVKTKAASLLKGLNNKDLDYAETLEYLKKNTNGKTNLITDIVKDMGYYGSNYLYKRHKSTFNNDKYYQGAEKYWGNTDKLDNEISAHEEYVELTKKDRLKAKEEVKSSSNLMYKNLLFNNIVSENGNIVDYDKFLKNAGYDSKTRTLGKTTYDERTGTTVPPPLYTAFQDLNSYWSGSSSRGVVTNVNPNDVHYFGGNDGKKYKEYGALYQTGDITEFNGIMRKAYNQAVKEYKQKFSDLNDPKKRDKDMGSGDIATEVLSHDYVDMKLDKNNNMINSGSYKGSNVNTIFNMMKTPENAINKENVTLISDSDIKSGRLSKASKSELDKEKKLNDVNFNNFFKGQDLSEMKVIFDRNSSIPYHATYTFVNQKTGKKLQMIAPADYIEKNKETFWKNTTMSVPEARFLKAGSLSLPDKDDTYTDAAIIQKNGIKIAVYKYLDSDGVTKNGELEIGDVQIEIAKQQFKEYFDRIALLRKEYIKSK